MKVFEQITPRFPQGTRMTWLAIVAMSAGLLAGCGEATNGPKNAISGVFRGENGLGVEMDLRRWVAGTNGQMGKFESIGSATSDMQGHFQLIPDRALKPTISILLIDSAQPIASDRLLPAGRLRDVPERAMAADAIVVTRLDDVHGDLRETYAPDFPAHKPIFGTHMETDPLLAWPGDVPCANGDKNASPDRRERILAVAGISRPERFMDRLA